MDTTLLVTPESRLMKQKEDLRKLQRDQQAALAGDKEKIRMIKGNKDSKHEIAEHEKHLIHVYTNIKTVDVDTKTIHEEERIVKVHARNFDQLIKDGAFAVYDEVKVIHDPRKNAPKEYNLRPNVPASASLTAATMTDAALAAREQKLKEREKQIEERLAKLEALESAKADVPPPPADLGEGKKK